MSKEIDVLCSRMAELLHEAESCDGIAFLEVLTEFDQCCAEILEDEEKALQSERFKSLVVYKCRLFDRKEDELKKSKSFSLEKLEMLEKFYDYERADNRLLVRIEDAIEYERKFHLECGFSEKEFHAFYRIRNYKLGKYHLCIDGCNYNEMSGEQLRQELNEEEERLEELEEELEELQDLDEEDYDEYDFESEEEYKEKLEEIKDDIYFCKCTIGLIEKFLEEKNS